MQPWRQMTYKFLNTIIDDLFAFVISMPILHRIAVFRDDLIFVLFLYQRYIYRVDYTRVNEFGMQLTDEERKKLELQNNNNNNNKKQDDNIINNAKGTIESVNGAADDVKQNSSSNASNNSNGLRQRHQTTSSKTESTVDSVD